MKKYTTKQINIPVSTLIAESVDQNATLPHLDSHPYRAVISTTSLFFSLSEFNKFTSILWGLVKVILGNSGDQYLELKHTSQDEGKGGALRKKSELKPFMSE